MVRDTALYDALDLDPSCSAADIKKAYRKLAMQHHPDKNSDAPPDRFQAIQGAYEVLSDEKQREQYDRFGAAKPGQGGGGGGFSSFFDDDDEEGVDMDDFFASMFGGGGFGGPPPGFAGQQQQRREQKKRGDDQVIELEVTLEECYTGKERKFELEKNVICSTCKGSGCKPKAKPRPCTGCRGQGIRMEEFMPMPGFITRRQVECSDCSGRGETVRAQDRCKRCAGKRVVTGKKRVNAYIERGAQHGDRIVLRGEGEQLPGQEQAGDVCLILNVKEHRAFALAGTKGLDLQAEITLTLSEALLGFDRLVLTHLDGRGLRVSQPAPGKKGFRVFKTGDIVRVKGEGFPRRKSDLKGDLLLKITVEMPTSEAMVKLTEVRRATLADALPPKRPDVDNPEITDEVELVPMTKSSWTSSTDSGSHGRKRPVELDEEESSEEDIRARHGPGGCHQQ